MNNPFDVVALVGSLRRGSFTRRFVSAMIPLAPASMNIDIIDYSDVSLYNQDDETAPPPAWVRFRARVKRADAVLFATPEYNRSVPGVLKNAIDVGSRPYGHSVWAGKPAAIISASPGAMGAFGANHHLRQCLVFLDMPTLQQPEAYIGHVDKLVDESGQIVSASRDFAGRFLARFAEWIAQRAR